MPDKRKILIQLDSDPYASVFDRVVAIDAGAEEVFSYAGVMPAAIEPLIHGAIFTRGPKDLHRTAVFLGGRDVALGEQMLNQVVQTFIGPLKCSVMLDANGANTTASAAVLAAARHMTLAGAKVVVLGGTGPVGMRVATLLLNEGADVRIAGRNAERAAEAAEAVAQRAAGDAAPEPYSLESADAIARALDGREVLVAAGPAGMQLLGEEQRRNMTGLKLAIDLNAVPPLGIAGIDVADAGVERDGVVAWGAIGVGAVKMKIHRAAVASLFERNDLVLDAERTYALGKTLEG